MGCKPFTVLLAALLVCVALDTQAQDQTWEQSIDLSRRAQASRDLDQAEQLLNLALARARGFATNDPRRVVSLMELAKLHLARGDYARPEQLYREADPIARQAWGSSSEEYADLLNEIGRYYHLRVRYEFAERFYRQCCSIRVQLLGREHADVAACLKQPCCPLRESILLPKGRNLLPQCFGYQGEAVGTRSYRYHHYPGALFTTASQGFQS